MTHAALATIPAAS